jgi:hypothetical protein
MKKITFIPAYDFVDKIDTPRPQPASKFIPNWYKKMPLYIDKNNKNHKFIDLKSNLTAKACVPILDSIASGYIISLPCDLNFVDPKIFGHRVNWEVDWVPVTNHSEHQFKNFKIFESFEKKALKFQNLWKIKPEKGYSLLYTHPFYHFDLPFFTFSGIVDADSYNLPINLPFFIKKDFFGILKMGTPICQIIPIKREGWKSFFNQYDIDSKYELDNLHLKIFQSYKKRWWNKKTYN